jgi:hypothetical protein
LCAGHCGKSNRALKFRLRLSLSETPDTLRNGGASLGLLNVGFWLKSWIYVQILTTMHTAEAPAAVRLQFRDIGAGITVLGRGVPMRSVWSIARARARYSGNIGLCVTDRPREKTASTNRVLSREIERQ